MVKFDHVQFIETPEGDRPYAYPICALEHCIRVTCAARCDECSMP